MKETIYENNYVKADYDTGAKIAYITARKELGKLNQDDYKKIITEMLDNFSKKDEIKAVLDNSKESDFGISPEVQDWVTQQYGKTFIPKGAKKYALVMPAEFISGLSYEQTVNEAEDKGLSKYIEIQMFTTIDEAEKWLQS